MKYLIFFSFILIQLFSFSQLEEAYFQYSIDVEPVDTSLQTKQTVAMLRDSRMELYFAPNRSRVDFKMGNLSMTSIVVDRNKNVSLTVSESMGRKMAQLDTINLAKSIEKDPSVILEFSDERKTILGLNCKKVVAVEKGIRTEYWYTEEIKVDAKDQQIINPNIPGFPVLFSKVENGIKMSFQLSNMKEKHEADLDAIFFTTPPNGFKLIEKQ
jgi:GLPGLI family protein